jgi:hypothetical protein
MVAQVSCRNGRGRTVNFDGAGPFGSVQAIRNDEVVVIARAIWQRWKDGGEFWLAVRDDQWQAEKKNDGSSMV